MSGRKINAVEQKLHQAALADPKKTLSQKECDLLIPDPAARMEAINFLLGTGLFKAMKDTKGIVSFRAVMKKEMEVKKDMSGEESMVLSHIQVSGNEGKAPRDHAKTELHQTVIDRCLKSLVQKQLIKAVKSVKYPTRKIYMLYHLDPSVEMTGGPWYTDNELDTEFIKLLCSACLRFIRDRTLPKQKSSDGDSSRNQPLYPISGSPTYPTAHQILTFLGKSRITETQLSVEHVEMLLNVLILDGEIERIPAFSAAMWDSSMNAAQEDESEEEQSGKKRKRKDKDISNKRKRKRKSEASDSEDESDSDVKTSRSKSKSKSKKRRRDHGDDSESESDESDSERRRKKKRRRKDDSDDNSDEEERGKRKKSSKSKSKSKSKKRKHDSSDSENETESSETASDDDSRSRSRSKPKSKSKSRQRSSSPVAEGSMAIDVSEDYGAYVYRAVHQERVVVGLSQAPCTRCPTFDFCKSNAPVNPKECVYYGEWLTTSNAARE
ncbi:uncharacterized protein FIBRA_07637 [Fibroporia radiculosa]|uniref:DNA-directed RNA polymerase III subunit RPC6 n=1 Tax=Fibroporia radiculosa TaxID=599839 RepID=J4GVD5_9APHY|nr:uncharacterized protein FIBRA_07637 [Fibroporia radiculosa]CCM05420.1 predicted protein [Fibroporia radiculosa]